MSTEFYARDFLNRPGHHRGAYVIASVDIDDDDVEPEKVCVDGELTISDCSRIVHVEFCATTPDELDNALHKARLLHRTVCDFVVALEAACAQVTARRAAASSSEQ